MILECSHSTEESGITAAKGILRSDPRPTAILATSDRLAIGVIEAAVSHQLGVPKNLRERTGVGREAARKRGVRFGRPRKLSLHQERLALRLVLEGGSVSDIARTFNVHVATIYRLAQVQ